MNIYDCWYQGNLGHACRTRGKKWMFVPELGQPDNTIYKHLSINDLLFKNSSFKQYEVGLETSRYSFSLPGWLKSLFLPAQKPMTVGGLLLVSS